MYWISDVCSSYLSSAPVHALDRGDQLGGRVVGRPADGRRRVQGSGEVERGDARGVVDHAGDVGGQVHHVGQVQHERRLGHVHRGAVRLECLGDRAYGVLVLLKVIRRPGQGGGQGQVPLVVTGATNGAGQHPRGYQTTLATHPQLGGRPDQAINNKEERSAGT